MTAVIQSHPIALYLPALTGPSSSTGVDIDRGSIVPEASTKEADPHKWLERAHFG
jgi:hypothetical protein